MRSAGFVVAYSTGRGHGLDAVRGPEAARADCARAVSASPHPDPGRGHFAPHSKTRQQVSTLSGATLEVVRNVPTSDVYLDGR